MTDTFKLILLRHGATKANEEHLYCGSTDLSLSPKGAAELLSLKAEGIYPDASIFLTSGMKRTNETLLSIYERNPDSELPCFCEMNFGDFEMQSYEQLKERADYQKWISDIHTSFCPNGEGESQFHIRISQGMERLLKEYKPRGETVLLVTHGGVISWAMNSFFPGTKNFYEWQPRNGHGYIITFSTEAAEYLEIPFPAR